jgi:molecular chaperone DnaK (HSP70)
LARKPLPDEANIGAAGRPFEVVGHDGRGDLGGRSIDQLLLGHVRRGLVRAGRPEMNRDLDGPQHLGALRTLQEHARQAKHALGEWESAAVPVAVAGSEHIVVVTAPELEHLVAELTGREPRADVRPLRNRGGPDPAGG